MQRPSTRPDPIKRKIGLWGGAATLVLVLAVIFLALSLSGEATAPPLHLDPPHPLWRLFGLR